MAVTTATRGIAPLLAAALRHLGFPAKRVVQVLRADVAARRPVRRQGSRAHAAKAEARRAGVRIVSSIGRLIAKFVNAALPSATDHELGLHGAPPALARAARRQLRLGWFKDAHGASTWLAFVARNWRAQGPRPQAWVAPVHQ